ncbi:MAG: 5-(carboxyamino)imidazole ribonucleotide synthase [Phycisphaerales bacterium]|nr:5-(carboxyamino)imidazole ribonucleotide synthase [Phycisphaerales bacterium]
MSSHKSKSHASPLLGVLGGGQLGRMLALAGVPLGLRFRFLDPSPYATAAHVGELIVGDFEDTEALTRFNKGLDAATFEFENVPAAAVRRIAATLAVNPNADVLETAQDRLREKTLFQSHGLAVPAFSGVSSLADLHSAAASIGVPGVLKTRRMGYDGKGQFVLRSPSDLEAAWKAVAGDRAQAELIYEQFVPFECETSLIACRARDGTCVFYPMPTNVHRGGMLRISSLGLEPALPDAVQSAARASVTHLMEQFQYVGVLAVEFFVVRQGNALTLLANEMAPRVHNSGHWSIDACATSQFESHCRAVAGLPLGPTTLRSPATAMLNIIGAMPTFDAIAAFEREAADRGVLVKLHDYAKPPREGRKLAHLNLVGTAEAIRQALSLASKLPGVVVASDRTG